MNRFEEMNVTEQQEISGGAIIGPVVPVLLPFINEKVAAAAVGAVLGGAVIVAKLLSGK